MLSIRSGMVDGLTCFRILITGEDCWRYPSNMLCCVELCCVVLYCVVLCLAVLCCIVLCCAVLCCIVLCCVMLCWRPVGQLSGVSHRGVQPKLMPVIGSEDNYYQSIQYYQFSAVIVMLLQDPMHKFFEFCLFQK